MSMMGQLAALDGYDPSGGFGLTPDEMTARIARDLTDAPTERERSLAYRNSAISGMQDVYRKAPDDVWTKHDLAELQGDIVPDVGMNPWAAMPQEAPAVARAHAEGAKDVASMMIPQSPTDAALMFALGPVGGKLARTSVGAAGLMGELMDTAEAKPKVGGAAKAIGSLFDYSKIHDVPDVKQLDLSRYVPPRGVSERVENLTGNKRVQKQMLDIIEQGKGMNADTFYYNEPLRQAFIAELGKKQGPKDFERYMDYVAATSPRSDVETNARNASYYYMLEKQGLPVPAQGGKNPEPYGHLAQNLHRLNAEKIRSGEYFDPFVNPKPLSFSQNLQGNFAPVTVDAHALKLPAMLAKDPNFIATSIKPEKGQPSLYPKRMLDSGEITMGDALKRPVFWSSKPNANEYGAMEQYYKRLADEAGLTPAQAQAAAWGAGGKMTGLESVAGDPFMRSVENRANKTAAERGISPAEALSQMMRGKAPLLGLGGAAAMGGIAAQDRYE